MQKVKFKYAETIIFIHNCFSLLILHYQFKYILTLKFPHYISIAAQTETNNITARKRTKTKYRDNITKFACAYNASIIIAIKIVGSLINFSAIWHKKFRHWNCKHR